jgi:isoleucyl-tRNA synthetase
MVRWIAPILSYTSDEIWETMQQELGAMGDSVFTAQWYEGLQALPDNARMSELFWQDMMALRDTVNKQIEVLRTAGSIKGSLTAEVTLYVSDAWQEKLALLGDELRFVLITSAVVVMPLSAKPENLEMTELNGGVGVVVAPTAHTKCDRCWHHREDVGAHVGHETLCGRCVENVTGSGEVRLYA